MTPDDRTQTMEPPISFFELRDLDSDWARQAFSLYERSFPAEERDSIEALQQELGNPDREDGVWFRFLLAVRDETVVGISVYTYHPEVRLGYLWYMAVLEGVRGQRIGSEVFRRTVGSLRRTALQRKQPAPVALCWEVERPEDTADGERRLQRERRIRFYRNNDAYLVEGSALHAPPVAEGMPAVVYHLMYLPMSPEAAPPIHALAGAMVDLILLQNYGVSRSSAYYRRSEASVAVRVQPLQETGAGVDRYLRKALAALSSRPTYGAGPRPQAEADATAPAWPGPSVQTLVAYEDYGGPADVRLLGAIVYEYFPLSAWGLLSGFFLAADVVDEQGTGPAPSSDGQKIGDLLLQRAVDELEELARRNHRGLTALFAEAVDFRTLEGACRLEAARILENRKAVGARWLGIDAGDTGAGVYPPGRPGRLLLIYPLNGLNPFSIEEELVLDFLSVYGASRGIPPEDEEAQGIAAKLKEASRKYFEAYGSPGLYPFRELPELIQPVLKVEEVALCLHLVTVEVEEGPMLDTMSLPDRTPEEEGYLWREAAKRGEAARLIQKRGSESQAQNNGVGLTILRNPKEYVCPVFHSFEIDILSYRFQDQPPIASVCEWEEQQSVCIRFPEVIEYVAEGKEYAKYFADNVLEARVSLSFSRFPQTGIRIWHFTLMPCEGAAFTEFDLIRLVGLYYSEQEGTQLLEQTRFRCGDRETDEALAEWLPFEAFLYGLSDQKILVDRPIGGTIEWIPSEDDLSVPWKEILSALYEASEDDQEAFRRLEDLYGRYEGALNACCGVVTGHFDYAQMSFAEMQDTLTPSSSAGTYAVWLHRSILTNIDLQDEMLERLRGSIGISPYLILPHAVLLHNECVVDLADKVEYRSTRPLKSLIEARRMIERVLRQHYTPNVFHYELERELYEIGSRSRGSLEKKQGVEVKLADLNSLIRDKMEERGRWSDLAITIFLGLLGLGSVLSIVDFFVEDGARRLEYGVWSLVVVIAMYVLILFSVFIGNRMMKVEGDAPLREKAS